MLWIHNINVIRNFINFVSDPGYCTTWSRAMSDFDLNHNQSLFMAILHKVDGKGLQSERPEINHGVQRDIAHAPDVNLGDKTREPWWLYWESRARSLHFKVKRSIFGSLEVTSCPLSLVSDLVGRGRSIILLSPVLSSSTRCLVTD